MLQGVWRHAGLLALLLLGGVARPAAADSVANYLIRGPGATVRWGLDQGLVDAELVVFAFGDLAPAKGDKPPPGPRLFFAATQLSVIGFTVIQRQWYGDVALKPETFTVSPDLKTAKLEVETTGTLEERRSPGDVTRKEVKGTLKIEWEAQADLANTSLTFSTQGTPIGYQFAAVGQGRVGRATATVKAEGLGLPLQLVGPGHVLSPSAGTLTLNLP